MYRMKNLSRMLTTLLVTMLLCIACGEKNVVDAVEKIFDEGIERAQRAESIEEVQQIYNEVISQVNDFKTEHLKEFAALDSAASSLQKTKETFVKACCIKLKSMHSSLETEDGFISIDENGNLYDALELAGDEGNYRAYNQNNPLNIIGYTHIYNPDRFHDNYISIQTPDGDYLYSEEDAERYYSSYISQFFFAEKIAHYILYEAPYRKDDDESVKNYVKKNLFKIVSNLPLDSSYPSNVVERVNKIYYDNKEEAATLQLIKRDYGESLYGYYDGYNEYNELRYLRLFRDTKDGGKLIIY